MRSFERKLDQIFSAQAETRKELKKATSGIQESSLSGKEDKAKKQGFPKVPSNHFLADHPQRLRASMNASWATTLQD